MRTKFTHIKVECEIVAGRLVPMYPLWKEADLQICVHGEKLRWTCDQCNEAIADLP